MRTFEVSTVIHRPPAPIWDTLIAFDAYHSWNSVVPSARGCARPGTRLDLRLKQPNGHTRPFHPTVIAVDPNVRLILEATVAQRRLLSMEHHFILQPIQLEFTQLIQRWLCSGLLIPIVWTRLVEGMRLFDQFGVDLKRQVEQGSAR